MKPCAEHQEFYINCEMLALILTSKEIRNLKCARAITKEELKSNWGTRIFIFINRNDLNFKKFLEFFFEISSFLFHFFLNSIYNCKLKLTCLIKSINSCSAAQSHIISVCYTFNLKCVWNEQRLHPCNASKDSNKIHKLSNFCEKKMFEYLNSFEIGIFFRLPYLMGIVKI